MPVASLVLLSPWGALVSLAAIVPVLAVARAARRGARAAHALRLPPPSTRPVAIAAGLAALGITLLGTAAAQPAVETTGTRTIRTESQALFVVDVSRSMLASAGAGEPTRLDRAQAVVRRLRAEIGDVPAGIAGMTDRVLPYIFPTADLPSFDLTLRSSVLPDSPPPGEQSTIATTFDALQQVVGSGIFAPSAERRACVLVTDGEARSGSAVEDGVGGGSLGSLGPEGSGRLDSGAGSPGGGDGGGGAAVAEVGSALAGEDGCSLVIVRVGGSGDRIHLPGGRVEGQYRPDASAAGTVEALADAAGGSAFVEGDEAGAAGALRAGVEQGPSERRGTGRTLHRLAPWLTLAGGLTLALLVALRVLPPGPARRRLFEYGDSPEALRGGH